MKKKLNFIWIDDFPQRKVAAENLAQSLDVIVEFIDVNNKDVPSVISNLILKTNEPHLIIIDHNLEEAHSGIFKKGSSVAASIRESWPECPIVCVSAIDVNEVDSQQKMLYEEIFSADKISSHYLKILSIAESYQNIKDDRPTEVNGILRLLEVPLMDSRKIASIFPLHNYHDKSLAVEISKWVRKVLIQRPGFLYDRLRLSTLIGVKIESFHKVEKYFENSKYRGVFSNLEDERWWKSESLAILFTLSDVGELPWERGRGIEGLVVEDFSICYATSKPFPETVAYVDQTRDATQEPVLIKESELHPDFESILYFDEIRLMKAAE